LPSSARVDLPVLTSLRFVAAAMIFAFHLREFSPSPWLYWIAPGMFNGVSFFFVLSGFVLTHAYGGGRASWRDFYLARIARIAPLHLFCLFLLLLALPLPVARGQNLGPAASVASFFLKATMLDSWAPMRGVLSSWNSVSWSISVEMAFYACFPLLLFGMTRRPLLTLGAAAAVSFGVLAAAVAAGAQVFVPDRDAITLVNLGSFFPPARVFEFALGMATCLAWRRWILPARLPVAAWTIIEAAALAGAGVWLLLAIPALVAHASGVEFVWLRASGSCGVFALLLAALAKGEGRIGRGLARRPFVALGEASFAFYLVHVIVMRTLRFDFGEGPGTMSALALSLGLAFLLHEAVEKPMRRRVLSLAQPRPALARAMATRAG
jgi:peptidoglycan/LPS O-acetylase OafA/YrhL